MPIFARNKLMEVQGFVLRMVNNNCPELKALIEGPRADTRANLTVVVLVVPVERGRPQVRRAFFAVTKEFSGTGVGLVVDGPTPVEDAILGFRWEGDMIFVRAEGKHLNPMGGGFYQLGMQMTEVLPKSDYAELTSLSF